MPIAASCSLRHYGEHPCFCSVPAAQIVLVVSVSAREARWDPWLAPDGNLTDEGCRHQFRDLVSQNLAPHQYSPVTSAA